MAKIVQVSDDAGANWFILPGGSGEINRDGESIDDTIFGQTFQSQESGIIGLSVSATALYKGFAGYVADIKKQGSTTGMSTEAMTLLSGKTFQIDDATKEIWDRAVDITVFDNAVDHTADVESIDYLFGKVTFNSSYSVTEPITITGSFFPTAVLGKATGFSLSMTADTKDTTDFPTAQANGGFRTVDPGLRSVQVQLDGVYDLASGLAASLAAREEFIIEINPDGNSKSLARGFFREITQGQSGDVGALEEESVTFALNVPLTGLGTGGINLTVAIPFGWSHAADTTLSDAIQKILTAWEDETKLRVQYLPDGVAGDDIDSVVTDISMATALSDMNEFSCEFTADGAATTVP